MKALSTTILIVVSAVVILVAALVVLTIFGGGMGQVSTLTKFKNNCLLQAKTSCSSLGTLPPTWDLEVSVGGKVTTCQKETQCNDCKCSSLKSEENSEQSSGDTPPSQPPPEPFLVFPTATV